MDFDLPGWMDIPKLLMISGVTLSTIQYCKNFIPEKWVKPSALPIALIIAFMLKFAETNPYVQIAVYALFAVVLADTGYKFLSNSKGNGGQTFTLPSKAQEEVGAKKP